MRTLEYTRIVIVTGLPSRDVVSVETTMPSPYPPVPTEPCLVLKFETPPRRAAAFVRANFGDEFETVDAKTGKSYYHGEEAP